MIQGLIPHFFNYQALNFNIQADIMYDMSLKLGVKKSQT